MSIRSHVHLPAVLVAAVSVALASTACSDSSSPAIDAGIEIGAVDLATNDGPRVEASVVDQAPTETAPPDGGKPDKLTPIDQLLSGDAAVKTPCGSLSCNRATEVCVQQVAWTTTYVCKPLPSGCSQNRNCACVGSSVCTGIYTLCSDTSLDNTVNCDCPNC